MDGRKFLVKRGCQPRKASFTSDVHWTTMKFTFGTGEHVLCAILIATETLSVEGRLGIDIFAECTDNILLEANYVLLVAIGTKQKKENEFIYKARKLYCEFCAKK